jgi:hypothetical protein
MDTFHRDASIQEVLKKGTCLILGRQFFDVHTMLFKFSNVSLK